MPLAVTRHGAEILDFYPVQAGEWVIPDADAHIPITFAVVLLQYEGQHLFIYNAERDQWELPGGGIEPGETLPVCAAREVWEEASQRIAPETLEPIGVYKIFLRDRDVYEFGALYRAPLPALDPFVPNSETSHYQLCATGESLEGEVSAFLWLQVAHGRE